MSGPARSKSPLGRAKPAVLRRVTLLVVLATISALMSCARPRYVSADGGDDSGAPPVSGDSIPDAGDTLGVPAVSGGSGADAGAASACAGDILIDSVQAWTDFEARGCVHLDGSLTFVPSNLGALSESTLQSVTKGLDLGRCTMTSVAFTELVTVGGDVSLSRGQQLQRAKFPKLQTVASLTIVGNAVLPELEFPALVEVTGHLGVQLNGALSTLSLPALARVGGPYLYLADNAAMTSVSLPRLERVSGNFGVMNQPALEGLSLPALMSSGAVYIRNTGLSELSLPALTMVSDVAVTQNPKLRQCIVDALRNQVPTAAFSAAGNDGAPNTCP